jgi:hypothetical protein
MRRTREQWAKLVATFGETSRSVEEFCAKRGIAPSTFRWWRWRLRDTSVPANHVGGVRLLPVNVLAEAPRAVAPVVIAVSGVAVRIEVGADIEYVSALVARLRGA